jgi:hypothetical protein
MRPNPARTGACLGRGSLGTVSAPSPAPVTSRPGGGEAKADLPDHTAYVHTILPFRI